MSSGVGRGRGWLNLKTQGTKSPVGEPQNSPPIVNDSHSPNLHSPDNRKFADAPDDFSSLINKIKQLNLQDDGIKFNQKIKYIVEGWSQDCLNAADVETSFNIIHKACLTDTDLAIKLVHLIASRTFLSQEIHQQNIRMMFLRKLQSTFEGSTQLQASNPHMFRNSVQLMGEFFNKARLATGQQFLFMASPLLSYLDMLLDSPDSADLKLFALQLYINGSALRLECPEKVAELLSKLRLKLCSDKRCSKDSKLWLLLALEVANNRVSLLPTETHNFYHEHLGDSAMAGFQGSYSTLTVQTVHNNKTLDSYKSNVNVLQVSTDSSSDAPSQNNISDPGSVSNSSGFQSETSQNSTHNRKDNKSCPPKSGNVKSGRPILGIGARLQRNWVPPPEPNDTWDLERLQNDPTVNNWTRNKSNSNPADWNKMNKSSGGDVEGSWREKDNPANQKKDWEKRKSPPKKKGWEHDDRFDTDYS